MAEPSILVIGAGPTGLAAGHHLHEHGRDEWLILEAGDTVGGLARSYTVDGYTFDIGGHVLFSRDQAFLTLLDRLLGDEHTTIRREAWVFTSGRHVRYPFQNHLRGLDPQVTHECLAGLVAARLAAASGASQPENFHDWVHATFGTGIARHFMLPYNEKVWAVPAERMTYDWISDRVAEVDLDAVLRNVVLGVDSAPWGPNSTFRYPLHGGTGRLWQRMAEPLTDRIRLRSPVVRVDTGAHRVQTSDGRWRRYERLLSTMPLDEFIATCADAPQAVRRAAAGLVATGSHIVAVAVDRPPTPGRNWVYYPDPDVPFHRVTHLSNYSPHVTARPGQTLLLTETSTSAHRPVPADTIAARVLTGLARVGLLEDGDRVLGVWRSTHRRTYPVPTLGRDAALNAVQGWLAGRDIVSTGRFGGWRYEEGNMDHAVAAGFRFADRVITGASQEATR